MQRFPRRFSVVAVRCASLFLAILALPLFSSLPASAQTDAAREARLRQTIQALTSYPTRVPGSPGNRQAANYLAQQMRAIGLQNVRVEEYEVTAPVSQSRATLSLGGSEVELYPIYPNHVVPSTTPEAGISGPLVYAGDGRPRSFNGLQVEDAIVVLDFNSGINWITAADLGARAIIFLEPTTITRGEAESKFGAMPMELPRYYAQGAAAARIRSQAQRGVNPVSPIIGSAVITTAPQAIVRSHVIWEQVKAYNVVGLVPGRNKEVAGGAGGTVILNAYYDSMAITPDLAPGAEAAGNAAALLELARHYRGKPAPYNLQFVLNGAHHIALAGTRHFAAEHFIDATGKGGDDKKKAINAYRAFIGLDLTSRTSTVGLFAKSSFYDQMGTADNILLNQFAGFTKKLNDYATEESKRRRVQPEAFFVDGVTGKDGRNWRSYLPSLVALDSEVAMMAQVPAISFATANDARVLQDTPFDRPEYVAVNNLATQISTIAFMLDRSFAPRTSNNKLTTDIDLLPEKSALSNNFGFVVTRGVYRDISGSSSFLPETPMPDEKLIPTLQNEHEAKLASIERDPELTDNERRDRLAESRDKYAMTLRQMQGATAVSYILERSRDYKSYSGVRGAFIERAEVSQADFANEERARTQFVFVGPRVGDSKGGGARLSTAEVYSLNRPGLLTFAPDQGAESTRFAPTFNKALPTTTYKVESIGQLNPDVTLIAFPCRLTTLADTVDQRYFTILTEMIVYDAATDAEPVEFGFMQPMFAPGTSDGEPVAAVFSKPGSRFKLIMAQGLLGKRLVVLNTDPEDKSVPGEVPRGATSGDSVAELQDSKGIIFEGAGVKVPGQDILERIAADRAKIAADAAARDETASDTDTLPGALAEDYDAATTANSGTTGLPVAAAMTDEMRPNRVIHVAYQVANDLWTLDQQRIRLLKGFGISNKRVDELHEAAGGQTTDSISAPVGGAIKEAEAALANFQYDEFYLHARRAFGLESRAYPDVEATSQDVLKGILFYMALLLPFSFFVERLVFGFPDVRKQIAGTSIVFLAVFTGIRYVHPAFELALTPFIILLAFVILALTVVVTLFLSSKFEMEIKRMKQGVHFADVGRLSTLGAALGLGIANMRRRPMRTALTCVTLILLTFTVLSFTSVTASISNFARPYGEAGRAPAYKGLMVRQPDWSAMQQAAANSLQNEFNQRFGDVARRSWYLSRAQTELLQLRVNNVTDPNRFFYAPALLGFTPEEKTIGSPVVDTLIAGRWFEPGETDAAILPVGMLRPPTQAEASQQVAGAYSGPPLGLTPENAVGARIQVAGKELTVIGIFNHEQFEKLRDLDNEQFTPVDYQSDQNKSAQDATALAGTKGEEAQVQSYEHMDANALLILPYDTVLALGGTTRSLAAGFRDDEAAREEMNGLMQRAALGIFGATEEKGQLVSRLYSSIESTSYEGFLALLVPVLIAAAIIANTMLGSVFERTREIGIYSSVGLAPVHVAALFIAEAAVYAVLGSISGYLIAQVVAKIITTYGLFQGITLNYSSSSAIISTLIVMVTVLLSTIYPAWMASRMSQPDIERRWRMSEPFGDVWRFQFPFTVSGQQPLGVAQFLTEFFETHTDTSVGKFYTDKVTFTSLTLREAVALLNDFPRAAQDTAANGANGNGKGGVSHDVSTPLSTPDAAKVEVKDATIARSMDEAGVVVDNKGVAAAATGPMLLNLDTIAADPDTEVYRLAMRVWLAPFDMGVSQDTDILLIPSPEPGLYELQLKLVRQSGEIAAWKRVNRGFISDLRKQLLLWRTIKRDIQQEYVLRGKAHVAHEDVPDEVPGAVVSEPAR